MSAEGWRAPGRSPARILVSLLSIAWGGVLLCGGVGLWRFEALDQKVTASLAGDYLKAETLQPLILLRQQVVAWEDVPGVRNSARILDLRIGQAIAEPAAARQLAAAHVLAVDPANSAVWRDLVEASWRASNLPLALDAWNMSYITGPREFVIAYWRVMFMAGIWPTVPREAKQVFFSQIQALSNATTRPFGPFWRQILARLDPAIRRQIEAEWASYERTGTF